MGRNPKMTHREIKLGQEIILHKPISKLWPRYAAKALYGPCSVCERERETESVCMCHIVSLWHGMFWPEHELSIDIYKVFTRLCVCVCVCACVFAHGGYSGSRTHSLQGIHTHTHTHKGITKFFQVHLNSLSRLSLNLMWSVLFLSFAAVNKTVTGQICMDIYVCVCVCVCREGTFKQMYKFVMQRWWIINWMLSV